MTLNLKNIKKIRLKDFNRGNLVKYYNIIYNDYIKPFDPINLSYFPFVGWFIPMSLNKDEFQKYHAKQAFVLAVYFAFACIFLYFFKYFIPEDADIIQLFIIMLIYLHYVIYFTLCFLGTKMIKKGEKGEFPYINQYITMFTAKIDI